MANDTYLNDLELKSLDLLIAYKRVNPMFLTDMIDAVGHAADAIVQVAGAAAVVTMVVGGAEEMSAKLKASAGAGISLEELVKLRQRALERK